MKKVRLINISQNKDISDYIDNLEISMPNIKEISSMVAKFNLEEKLIQNNDEISISVLDEAGNTIYNLTGKARLQVETLNYTNLHGYNYEVKESYSNLFEKVISETQVFYDLYLCNNADVNNSLMHIIAKNLGFKNLDFHNAIYENGQYIRIPFTIFRENEKWIDELQTLISATNSILYIRNKKLFFKVNNFDLNKTIAFNRDNIITKISKTYKAIENNGVKVLYDRYKKLENQVVFNLKSKITVNKNTNKDTEVKSMKINYITSSVADPAITKATGYYFRTPGDVNSKVDIDLVRNTHYVLEEFTETQAIVKFYNPFNYDLIIDNFEIKGIPLVMYTDNSAIVKNKIVVEKNQENFNIVNKNKYIQTPELAINIVKQIYRSNISSQFSYNLDTIFINNLQLGDVYNLAFENIDVIGRLISYTIQLRPSDFRLSLKLDEIGSLDNVALSYTDSLNSNSQYIDLSNVEKSIEENKEELKTVKADINSKLHRMTTTPTENVVENDIWFNPETNAWKKFYNNKWNSISEAEILPAMKLYNSVETNVIKFQNTADKVGAYLLNDGEKFGSLNGELASVTFDKMGQFEAVNPNNKVALNIKDPANPSRVNSKILLGVTDVNDPKWNDVIFAVGDEASPARIEFKNGQLTQTVNGEKLGAKLNNVDKNISNLSKGISDSLNTAKSYTDTKKNEAIASSKSYADSKKTEIENSLRKEITFEVGGEADKYYPVLFNSTKKQCKLVIYRKFDEKAPDTWNTATHKGGLFLELTTNFYGTWSGNAPSVVVNKFDVSYSTAASKIEITIAPGVFVWLRGGGALYHAYCDNFETNNNLIAAPYINGFDSAVLGGPYASSNYRFTLPAGTFEQTGSASSIKALYAKEQIKEVDRRLTNADGRLTQLEQNYQNTVQDVTNFKTQTADRIDTVQGALDNGNFVVNGNTTFADGVRFVSRGTNEVITIANGSIDFHRDGQKLTRIKNSRYGTIVTDSAGKGVVNFPGFKQPMIVLTSIKSANFGKNMASVFCYAEHITGTQYRMFVGGTNERYTEAKPIKVVGTEWSTLNAFKTTLLEMTCNFKESGGNYTLQNSSNSYEQYKDFSKRTSKVLKVPKFNVKIVRVDGTAETILYAKDYTVSYYFKGRHDHNGWRGYRESYYKIEPINLTKTFNLLKTYTARTNVKFKLVITILESNFTIERYFAYSHTSGGADDKSTSYASAKYVGTLRTITPADFTGLSITASSETSTLSGVTGTGEVQYIAMEID